ncbi:MAG: oligosaccharide flippase family protein, partial [Chloroflexi bacterium]|nr:oligosaccharide flippase family protein [Chloroflexota bacterium]
LAGFGFDLARRHVSTWRLSSLIAALGVVTGGLAWWRLVLPRIPADDRLLEWRNYAALACLMVLVAAAAWTRPRLFGALAILLTGADLVYFGASFNTAADPALLAVTPGSVSFLQQDHSLFRITAYGQDKMFEANGNTLYGIQDARGYDSVILGTYAQLSGLIEPQDQLQYNRVKGIDRPDALDSPLLDLLNVKYVLSSQALSDPKFRQVYEGPDGRVYQNTRVLPRAFVAPAAVVEPDGQRQLQLLTSLDLSRNAVIGQAPGLSLPNNPGQSPSGLAVLTTYSGRKVDVTAAGPGVLVLTDNNFPGWNVTVDGQPANLLTADYTFRGVALPAGSHQVEFTFAPRSLIAGGLVSALCLALIGVLLIAQLYLRAVPVERLAAGGRVTKNSLTPLASSIGSRLLSFGFSVFYFRVLGLTQVGKYVTAVAVWLFLDTIIGFGLQQIVARDVARDKSRTQSYISTALAIRLGLTVIVGLPVALGAAAMHRFAGFDGDTAAVLAVLILGFVPSAFSNVFSHVFDGHELMEYKAFTEMLTSIVNIGLGVVFVLAGWDILGLAAAAFLTNVFTAGLLGFLLAQRLGPFRARFDSALIRTVLRGAYPIMLNQLLVVLFFKIDVPILRAFRSNDEVGIYGAAYKFVDALLVIPATFVPAVFPILSRQATSQRDALKRGYELALKILLIVSLPLLAGFEVFAGDIIAGFYGEKFAASAVALRILMLFLPFSYINGLTQYVLVALERQQTMLRFFAVTAVFNVAVNLALIPRFGFVAASAVTAASEVVLLAPLYWLTVRDLGSPRLLAVTAVRPFLAAAGCGAVMLILRGPLVSRLGLPGDVVAALAGAAVYACLLLVLKTFDKEETDMVRRAFKRAPGGPIILPAEAR